MANFFDQFDAPAAPGRSPAAGSNFFDQFDTPPTPTVMDPAGNVQDRATAALQPFFERGLSARNSAGQWTPEARARLTREGVDPLAVDQRQEKALLTVYQQKMGQDFDTGSAAVGRGIINGVPVIGPALLRGTNKMAAFLRATSFGIPYDQALKDVENFGERAANTNPKATTGGELLGGVVGTAPLVAAAPAAFGAGTAGLAARTGASGLTSVALGGADAAVRSDGDLQDIRKGALLGGALGLTGPLAGAAIGKGVRAASSVLGPRNVEVPGASNAAAAKLAEDLKNSGGADAVRARLADLGPEGMLLDASPSFEGRAQGLAIRPETRETITAPITERAAGANARLAADVDATLGATRDPAAFNAALDDAYDAAVPRLYQAALSNPGRVDTSDVLATIGRLGEQEKGGAQHALQRAWSLLHTEGDVEGVGRALVPDRRPEALHNAKEALDAQIAAVRSQQGSAARSELRALTTVRSELNQALEAQVPGYADANRTAQHFFQQREAFDRGQTLLNGGREAARPAQLAADTAAMTPEVADAQRAGLRAEVDRLTGTQLNDRLALRKALLGEGDYNRSRMGTVFGEEPTAGLAAAVDREAAFDIANRRIVENSQSAQRLTAAGEMAPREVSASSGEQGVLLPGLIAGKTGAAAGAGMRALRLGTSAIGRAADLTRNREAAAILTMKAGPEREALISALEARLAAAERGEIPANATERFVRQMLQSQNDRSERRALAARALVR
ncbi:hypothetical protein [Methylobacterium sp. A54F]